VEINMKLKSSTRGDAPSCHPLATALALAGLGLLMHVGASGAQATASQVFSSPEQAARALYAAVRADDRAALAKILGTGDDGASANDPVAEPSERDRFVRKYQEMHRLVREADGTDVLYVGAENWPFPYPLVVENDVWHFDADTGMQEVMLRRIGEAEMAAIATCRTLATARQSGEHDSSAQESSDLFVRVGNDGRAVPFHGYHFRRVKVDSSSGASAGASQPSSTTTFGSRFAYVAYPAEYRVTGVMTFVVEPDGTVYEADLGRDTIELAQNISGADASYMWRRVDGQ
jgi:Protein of unknown function (DUF2950)